MTDVTLSSDGKPPKRSYVIDSIPHMSRRTVRAAVRDLDSREVVVICDHFHRTGAGARRCGWRIVRDLQGERK